LRRFARPNRRSPSPDTTRVRVRKRRILAALQKADLEHLLLQDLLHFIGDFLGQGMYKHIPEDCLRENQLVVGRREAEMKDVLLFFLALLLGPSSGSDCTILYGPFVLACLLSRDLIEDAECETVNNSDNVLRSDSGRCAGGREELCV
jgi:hypothetical protein